MGEQCEPEPVAAVMKVSLVKLRILAKLETFGSNFSNETTKLVATCQSHKANWKIKRYFSEKNMTKNLLVELGLEELPAYVVTPSENN